MKRCAFLTTDDLSAFVTDDELAHAPLRDRGWDVTHVPWRARADWSQFDAVVVRTPWDYQHEPDAFTAVLREISARSTLLNPLGLMLWNMRKTYLRDLETAGVLIPPTRWLYSPTAAELDAAFDALHTDEIVVKPQVGANAGDTLRVRRDGAHPLDELHGDADRAAALFRGRHCMVQPFLSRVLDEGETSVILFNGESSHVITKTPKRGDFRVQEEHGGEIRHVAADPAVLRRASACLAALDVTPLYARADFVRTGSGDYALMELELIEPSLYFRLDPGSAERFAEALDARCGGEAAA